MFIIAVLTIATLMLPFAVIGIIVILVLSFTVLRELMKPGTLYGSSSKKRRGVMSGPGGPKRRK